MTINEDTGMIRWTPNDDQVMLHAVTVQVSDGIETTTATFEIDVKEGTSSSSTILIAIAAAVIGILTVIGVILLLRKKRAMDEEARHIGEEEREALEKEREDEYASYEELYGVPAPAQEEEDEELTTEELRDRIHDQIEKLEHMESEE
jgi:hypothetical protein